MKFIFIFSSFCFLLSCENNPLGGTAFKACNHSPENKTGLPLTCQVNIPTTENLNLWLDAHDSGTLTLLDQTDVINWLDKSGSGVSISKDTGEHLKVEKKGSNDRNSVRFSGFGVYDAGGGLSILPSDSDFCLSISLKSGVLSANSFKFENGSNFSIYISPNKELLVSMGSRLDVSSGIFFENNSLYNLILNYNASLDTLRITEASKDIFKSIDNLSGAGQWVDLVFSGESLSINEVILYGSFENEQSLKTYLSNKWGF